MTASRASQVTNVAQQPFLEKPPLSYWMSAGALALFGDSAAAARVPNLLYALISALAVGALALAMQTEIVPALIAALVAASALTAYRVTIWLAPDACLLAGCALALLGAWHGYRSPAGTRKAAGYALMHVGAAIGFMAKSAPGWLVPALALLTLIAWERRWSELRRWELYAGFALQALIIGPWLLAVTRTALCKSSDARCPFGTTRLSSAWPTQRMRRTAGSFVTPVGLFEVVSTVSTRC